MFMLLQSSFRRQAVSTKITIVKKRVWEMFALNMVSNIGLSLVEEAVTNSADISPSQGIGHVFRHKLEQLTRVLESLA